MYYVVMERALPYSDTLMVFITWRPFSIENINVKLNYAISLILKSMVTFEWENTTNIEHL